MLHVVMDEGALGGVDDAFDGLKLLRQINAGPCFRHHGHDGGELALRLFQSLGDFKMRCMLHPYPYYLGGRVSRLIQCAMIET